jgi:methyl-accepting chemotaxis protein
VAIPPGLIGGWLLLAWLLRPLDRITRTAERIGAGEFGERIDLAAADVEIAGLATTLNLMLDRLDQVREKLSRFDTNLPMKSSARFTAFCSRPKWPSTTRSIPPICGTL